MSQEFDRDHADQLIATIIAWSDDNEDKFDPSFVHSCAEQLESRDFLSERQMDALENIAERWKIYVDSGRGNPKVRDILSKKAK